jgi:hypothetical protein
LSSYIVDRHHIAYLVHAFCYRSASANVTGCPENTKAALLWTVKHLTQANRNSVSHCYIANANCEARVPGDLTTLKPWTSEEIDSYYFTNESGIQIIKSCKCYSYQSCCYPGWEKSKAHQIINEIIRSQIHRLPGYDAAIWGAPEPEKDKEYIC